MTIRSFEERPCSALKPMMKSFFERERASLIILGRGVRSSFTGTSLESFSFDLLAMVKSRGAAAITRRSYPLLSSDLTDWSIPSVVSTLITLALVGGGMAVGPVITVTLAPLTYDSLTKAKPIFPELELVRYLTASM